MEKLSVYLITLNEEIRLEATLRQVAKVADEIIIVDCGSRDETEEIAKKYGARFVFNTWKSFGDQVAVAERLCTNNFVLRLDADEVMTDELVEEINKIKEHPQFDGYKIPIYSVFPGMKKVNRFAAHMDRISLYHRDKMSMLGNGDHDAVDFLVETPKITTTHGYIEHYSYISIFQAIEKRNCHTDTQINVLAKNGKRYSPWRMVGISLFEFLRTYILDRNFLYGWWGYIFSVNYAYARFTKFSKWYEYEQKQKYGWLDMKKG